jgi:hypothetical protein
VIEEEEEEEAIAGLASRTVLADESPKAACLSLMCVFNAPTEP